MSKKKDTEEQAVDQLANPFVGGEEDDLMDMEYIQDSHTPPVDTHPPETKEEAEKRAEDEENAALEEESPAESADPAVSDEADEDVVAEDEEQPEDIQVPKHRFDDVNERMKKAEARQEELEAKLKELTDQQNAPEPEPEPEPFDFTAKEKEASDALLEGDNDKYAAIQAEIRAAMREEILRETRQEQIESSKKAKDEMSFEETGARIEAAYPEFQADNEAYNKEARDEMIELYVGYVHSGNFTRAEALQKAADKTVKMYGFEKGEPVDDGKVVDIKKADVKKKAQAANQQPPKKQTTAKDNEEPRFDAQNMSDEEFEQLPESTKRRLRGDVL